MLKIRKKAYEKLNASNQNVQENGSSLYVCQSKQGVFIGSVLRAKDKKVKESGCLEKSSVFKICLQKNQSTDFVNGRKKV